MTQDSWRDGVVQALQQRQWGEAQHTVIKVLESAPHDAQAWVWLGEALEQQGQRDAAWHCYDRGWMLDPQADWVSSVMARLGTVDKGMIPPWLEKLLAVPEVRVAGAVLTRNEEVRIGRCLEALKPAVDTLVVVDTGSTDRTVEIARSMGATIVETAWSDDFAAARNAAEQVLGDSGWVLWVDADEFLQPDDVTVPRVIAGLFDQKDPPVLCRIVQVNHIGEIVDFNYDSVRLYPLGRGLAWRGVVHEQVMPAQGDPRLARTAVARIRVDHWGYEREIMKAKGTSERNIRLLQRWTHDEPNNPAAWGFLGRDLYVAGQLEEAARVLYHAETLATNTPEYGRLPEVRAVLCEALVRLNRLEEARTVAERLTEATPDFPVGWFWRAQIAVLEASARLENAQKWAEQARTLARTYRGQVSVPREIPEFLVLVAEADALKMQGRLSEAHEKYQTALRARPNHPVVENQLNFLRTEAAKVLKGRSAGTPQITLRPVVADPRRAPNS